MRFTIRDVLWLTLVVGLALGWWVHWRRLVVQRDEAQDEATRWSELAYSLGDELKWHGWTVDLEQPFVGWQPPPGIQRLPVGDWAE